MPMPMPMPMWMPLRRMLLLLLLLLLLMSGAAIPGHVRAGPRGRRERLRRGHGGAQQLGDSLQRLECVPRGPQPVHLGRLDADHVHVVRRRVVTTVAVAVAISVAHPSRPAPMSPLHQGRIPIPIEALPCFERE